MTDIEREFLELYKKQDIIYKHIQSWGSSDGNILALLSLIHNLMQWIAKDKGYSHE